MRWHLPLHLSDRLSQYTSLLQGILERSLGQNEQLGALRLVQAHDSVHVQN